LRAKKITGVEVPVLSINELSEMKAFVFKPKLISALRTYSKETFMADLMAGLIVGIVALPLAIAFGIASGVSPEKGIITAIIAGFIISFLGGSKIQIGGPTGAFIVIVYGIIQQYGEKGLIVATIMAGVLLILLGLFKLGAIIKFIPYPIIVGFTSGIAVTIFTTQIADIFGLSFGGETVPGDFPGKWVLYFRHFDTVNWWNTAISAVSILIIVFSGKIIKKIPGSLIAIILVTVTVYLLKTYAGIDCIDTIGDRFTIKAELPDAEVPVINWEVINGLLPAALTIAVLGAIESLLSATVADGMIGDKHDSNAELIAQGTANIITPLFGGIPATGAIARTMTNINNGGKTPVAGMIHAVVLLLILLLLMPLAQYIPMACLAGVLVIVSYNMSEWRTFKALMKNPKSDVSVLLITFFLTVIFDLTIAIEIGLVIACLLFMRRVAETTEISVITDEIDPSSEVDIAIKDEHISIPKDVEVYEINGPYFFGIANRFEEQMITFRDKPKVRIIRMRKVPFIDSTGIHNLTNLCRTSQKEKITIVLSGVNKKVHATLEKAGFYELIGKDNICPNINVALERAKEIIPPAME
jgi:SulP family sulfate permease